jgi:diguanylate cyclase (GGDEF)-like protein
MTLLDHSSLTPRDWLAEARYLSASGSPALAYELALAAHHAALNDEALTAETADFLADCCLKMARHELGIGYGRIAASIWKDRGDIAAQARVSSLLAEFLADIGAPDAASMAEQAMELAERSEDLPALARANMAMGLVLFMARAFAEALPFSERAVTISRQAGFSFPVAIINWAEAIFLEGKAQAEDGDQQLLGEAVGRAVALSREALAEGRKCGDGWIERLALNNIAYYSMHVGDIATATAALAEFELAPGEPTLRCTSYHQMMQAGIKAAEGRLADSRAILEHCLQELRSADYLEMEVLCYRELANVLERLGLYQESLAAHRQYHACFARQASEGAQRLARVAAYESQARALREAAVRAQSLAANLVRSNTALAREAERLLRASLEDSLTGLPNRRRLEIALKQLADGRSPFACAMLDIDHFKQVNDRFSHAVGDTVLREIGLVFSNAARQNDLVVRFGGEEFALVLDTVDASLVLRICERLRASVAGHEWHSIQSGLAVTVSIGMALSTEAAGPEAVLKLADFRLYQAKHEGRNRVVGPLLHSH